VAKKEAPSCVEFNFPEYNYFMEYKPATEERIWAAFSHASAILFGMGLVIPAVAWNEQRKKSQYASFQALQALGYQTIGYTLWFLIYLLFIVVGVILFPLSVSGGPSDSLLPIIIVVIVVFILGSIGLYMLLPVIGVIATSLGKDFRYPILGIRLAKYLGYDPSAPPETPFLEKNEDNWIASVGHFSVIIPIWGILLPGLTFITQKNRSTFLRFQAAQTVLFQVVGFAGYLIGFVLYFMAIFAIIPFAFLSQNINGNEGLTIIGFVFVIFLLCCAGCVVLIVPLYHILGQWAGYRLLKGDNYRYPFIGSLTDKILKKFFGNPPLEVQDGN
jgi:uncharacterized Tic20 family protein